MEKSKKRPNFNATHPELKLGEKFLCNAGEIGLEGLRRRWKTLRTGNMCFTQEGIAMNEDKLKLVPVFINIEEK
jgi:hypothetical protein